MTPYTVGSHYGNTAWDLVPKRFNLMLFVMFGMFVLLPFIRPLLPIDMRLEYFAGFIPFNFFLVAFVGGTAREFLARPLSITLPNQKHYLRRHLLLIGIVTNLLYIIPMLKFPATDTAEHIGAIIAVFCAGMSIFLGFLWTGIRFLSWTEASIMGMLMAGTGMLQFLGNFPPYASLVIGIIESPALLFLLMILLWSRYWRVFTEKDRMRKLIDTPVMSLVESGDMKATQEFYDEAFNSAPQKKAPTQQWFLDLSDRLQPLHDQNWFCLRHRFLLMIRGSLGKLSPGRLLTMLSSLIPIIFLLLFINMQVSYVFILFFGLWLSAFSMVSQEIHSPQLPYNRRDMARTEVLLSFFNSVRALTLCAITLLLFKWLDSFFFDRNSQIPSFACLSYLFVACPFIHALRMLISNHPAWGFAIFMALAIVGQIQYYVTYPLFINAGPAWWLLLYLLGWALLIPVAYRRYCSWDLVSNRN